MDAAHPFRHNHMTIWELLIIVAVGFISMSIVYILLLGTFVLILSSPSILINLVKNYFLVPYLEKTKSWEVIKRTIFDG